MPLSYPILQIQPEWVLEPEDMGTKEKFWYRPPGENQVDCLFKRPRPGTGEHWAEKIAAEVAAVLGIPHATVDLAEFEEVRGSVSASFTPGDLELWHGNQIMKWMVAEYDPNVRRGQSDHSFANIWESIGRVFKERRAAEQNRRTFAGYLVLDALIGNTDRHHENWGIMRLRRDGQWKGRLAPTFDHASSLGREMLDSRRTLLLEENRVDWYSERGRGGIYQEGDEQTGLSPLELVRRAADARPSYFAAPLARVEDYAIHWWPRL